jgi:transcriptional regulator with XRE-family HTH domain
MTSPRPSLPDTLRSLREASGLSQTAVVQTATARSAGINQPKLSRAETGRGLLDMEQITALCRIYRAPSETRQHLLEMTEALAENSTPARMVLQSGGYAMQERIHKLESAAKKVRNFSPSAIHGLLQVRGYIEALFGDSLPPGDLARTVQARLNGQAKLDSGREFTFVMAEGALRWCMGSPAIMAEQLEHLARQSERANIRVGIIAWTTPTTVPGLHPFTLYDDVGALVGTPNATAVTTDARNITAFTAYWDELQPFVSWDDDARAAIRQAAEDYRRIT